MDTSRVTSVDGTTEERIAIIGRILSLGSAEAMPVLLQTCLTDSDSSVRRLARQGVLSLRKKSDVPLGFESLDSPSRLNIVNCLALMPRGSHPDFMKRVILEDPDILVRRKAIAGLGLQGDRTCVPFFSSLARSEDSRLIPAIVKALGFLEDPLALLAIPGIPLEDNTALHEALKLINSFSPGRIQGFFSNLAAQGGANGKQALIGFFEIFPLRQLIPLMRDISCSATEELAQRARRALENQQHREDTEDSSGQAGRQIIDRLQKAMTDEDSGSILETFARLVEEGAVANAEPEIFTVMSRFSEPTVRAAAIRLAGMLGTPRALAKIIRNLNLPNPMVRAAAAEALAFFVTDPTIPELLRELLEDSSPAVVGAACKSIGILTSSIPSTALEKLMTEMGEEGKLQAVEVISSSVLPQRITILARLAEDTSEAVSHGAREALESLALCGVPEAIQFMETGIARARQEGREQVKSASADSALLTALARAEIPGSLIAGTEELFAVDELFFKLESGSEDEKVAALQVLEAYSDPVTLEAVKVATRDSSRRVRRRALLSFRRIRTGRIGKRIQAGDSLLRLQGKLENLTSEHISAFEQIMTRGDRRDKIQALKWLPAKAGSDVLAILHRAIQGEKDNFVRPILATVTGMLGDPSSIALLAGLAQDGDPRVRANAVEGLFYIGDASVLPIVAPLITDSEKRPRRAVVNLLRGYEDAAELARFIGEWSRHPDRERRMICARILGYLAQGAAEPHTSTLLGMMGEEKSGKVFELLVKALAAVCMHLDTAQGEGLFRRSLELRLGTSRQKALKRGYNAYCQARGKASREKGVTEVFRSRDFEQGEGGEYALTDMESIRRELREKDPDLRRSALDAMIHSSGVIESDLELLTEIMNSDPDGTVRYAAARALKRMDSSRYEEIRTRGREGAEKGRESGPSLSGEDSAANIRSTVKSDEAGIVEELQGSSLFSDSSSSLAYAGMGDEELKKLVVSLIGDLSSEMPRVRGAAKAQLISMSDSRVDKVLLYATSTLTAGAERHIRDIMKNRTSVSQPETQGEGREDIREENQDSWATEGSTGLNSPVNSGDGKISLPAELLVWIIEMVGGIGAGLGRSLILRRALHSLWLWIILSLFILTAGFFHGQDQVMIFPWESSATQSGHPLNTIESQPSSQVIEDAAKATEGREKIAEHLKKAEQFRRSGKIDSELREYHSVLQLNRKYAMLLYTIGTLLHKKGELREASVMLLKALETDPFMLEALMEAGNVEQALGQIDSAARYYQRVLENSPNHSGARDALQSLRR